MNAAHWFRTTLELVLNDPQTTSERVSQTISESVDACDLGVNLGQFVKAMFFTKTNASTRFFVELEACPLAKRDQNERQDSLETSQDVDLESTSSREAELSFSSLFF